MRRGAEKISSPIYCGMDRLRPVCLAVYMAESARCTSASRLVISVVSPAMPRLILTSKKILLGRQLGLRNAAPKTFCHHPSHPDVCLRQKQDEFVAAVACQDIHFTQLPGHPTCNMAQHLITGEMSIRIVDEFEMIDIDHNRSKRMLETKASLDLPLANLVEAAPVIKPCQSIRYGRFLRFAVQLGIVEGVRSSHRKAD